MVQVIGDLPGAAPLPLHWSHSSRRRTFTCLVTPNTASSNSSVRSSRISAPRCARDRRRRASTAEHVTKSEKVAEDVLHVDEVRRIESATAAIAGNARMSEAVVARTLLAVGQHRVRFAAFLELLFRFRIVRIAVGMVLHRQLAIGALDLLLGRRAPIPRIS